MGLFDQIANIGRQGLGLAGGAVKAVGNHIANMPKGYTPPDEVGTNVDPLRSMNPAQKVIMALGEMGARVNGQAGPITELRQRALQQYQMKRQEFGQNLDAIEKADKFLDSVPLAQRADRAAKLKEKLKVGLGVDEELYDSIIGDPDAKGLLAQFRDDPEVNAVLQNPMASLNDIKSVTQTPGFRQRAVDRQDQQLIPVVEKKIQGLLSSPAMAPLLQKVISDGQFTIEEIKQLNEQAGEGPDGFKLSPEELGTLERQQERISQRIPGFKTTSEFGEKRKTDAEFEDFKRKEQVKFEHDLALKQRELESKLNSNPALDPAQRQILLADYRDNLKSLQGSTESISSLEEMDRILATAVDVLDKKKVKTGPLAKYIPDAARTDTEAYNALQQAFGNEWLQAVQGMRGLGQLSNNEGQALSKTTGGFDKDEYFNLEDLRARRRLIKTVIANKKAAKAIAEQEANRTRSLAELPQRQFVGDGSQLNAQPAGSPPAPEAGPAKTGGAVKMKFPDGSVKLVPPGDVERYKQWGEVVP